MSPRLLVAILLLAVVLVLALVISDIPTTEVPVKEKPVAARVVFPPVTSTTTTVLAPSSTVPPVARTAPTSKRTLSSTGYCETGHMANGQPAHDGAVSSKILPRGSRWRVLTGRFAGRVFTVEDIGSLAIFDIAMPGRCADAIAYGAPTITIEAA